MRCEKFEVEDEKVQETDVAGLQFHIFSLRAFLDITYGTPHGTESPARSKVSPFLDGTP
jgi:hypothetical protein